MVLPCRREAAMGDQAKSAEMIVRCECGFEARAEQAQLVPIVQKHGREAHNMEATPEQVLAMARPA
jgi:predicted small metal-binding protein